MEQQLQALQENNRRLEDGRSMLAAAASEVDNTPDNSVIPDADFVDGMGAVVLNEESDELDYIGETESLEDTGSLVDMAVMKY